MKQQKNSPASALARFGRDKRVRGEQSPADRAGQRPRQSREGGDERPRRDAKPTGRVSYNPNFTADNRPVFEPRRDEERQHRPFGERQHRSDDRPRAFGAKPRQFGERDHAADERPRRQFGDKPASDERREGSRPFGERKFVAKRDGDRRFGDRNRDGRGDRSHDDRPRGNRSFGEKPRGEGGRKFGDKPAYKRRDEKPAYPRYNPEKQSGAVRLNRFIAQSGICSRREADDFIQAGLVSINGQIVTELGTKVLPTDEVKFNDSRIQGQKKVYLVLNKPKGYVTSLDDPHAGKTVMELVEGACSERIYPVGRLDKNSLGLLLFTNDGDLTKQLTHPSYKKKKIYQVSLDKPLTRADMDRIAEGITLEDGEIYADEISYVKENKQEVGIEIHSGRNRIVRRIFEFLGYTVQKLDRVYYAGLTKKNLNRGRWRFLTDEEVQRLKSGQYE